MRTFLAAALLLATPAVAQEAPQCGPAKEAFAALKEKFKETPAVIGAINEQAALVIVTSPDGGTWTALVVRTDGTACLISKGVALSAIGIPPSGQGI